ncbi:hypothetical protein P2318_28580 [Myxococcaceae bacterium GXIMD 01537]
MPGYVVLALLLGACAMPESVLRGDGAHARGDDTETLARYEEALRDTYLTPSEFAHVSERLEAASARELRRLLEALETKHREGPVEPALLALTKLRAERAPRWWSAEQEHLVEEARDKLVRRAWSEVEAQARLGRYRAALERAQALALFLPPGDALWPEVRRLEASFRETPVEPPALGQPRFPPSTEASLRRAEAELTGNAPSLAQGYLVDAAESSGQPFEDFVNSVIAAYGLDLPYLERKPPVSPTLPEGVRTSSLWSKTQHGDYGLTAAEALRRAPELQQTVNGFWAGRIGGELLLLHVPNIPTQPSRVGAYAGYRMEFAFFAHAVSGWGWTLHDDVMVALFMGGRLSPAHVYPRISENEPLVRETGFSYGGMLAYRLLVGYRGPRVGLLLGARPQYSGYQVGDVTASGTMLPLEARLEVRWSERYPVFLEGWFTPSDAEHASRGLMLRLPLGIQSSLFGRYERLKLSTRMGGLERDDRIDLGSRDFSLYTLGLSYGM